MKSALGAVAIVALAGVSGDMAKKLEPTVNPKVQLAGVEAHETHASASLLGQFRMSAATWLYLHADLYLHNGVEMRPQTQTEIRQGQASSVAATNDLGAGEGMGETTVIPAANVDFRGWIGDLERETGAYKDMKNHVHNPPQTAIPLFKLMTTVDPTFIQGWTMGAMVIAWDPKTGPRNAVKFLSKGVEENPTDFRLRYETGFYLAAYSRSLAEALPWFEQARNLAANRKDLAPDETESLRDTYRWLVMCLRDLGRKREEILAAKEGINRFPDDPILLKLARNG